MNHHRVVTMYVSLAAILLMLLARLFYLQIMAYDNFHARAEDNSTRTIDQIPSRGLIYDRYGRRIVENRPTFALTITLSEFDTLNAGEMQYVRSLTGMTDEDILKKLRGAWPYAPVVIKPEVDFVTIAHLEEERRFHRGIGYKVDINRIYADDITMPHLIGYMSQITDNTIGYYKTAEFQDTDYKIGERVGVSGLEKFYEVELRGEKGYHRLETNAKGQVLRDLGISKHPRDGYNLYLSIDNDYQKFVESALGTRRGSIMVADTRTGEILAATSKPDYDFRWFVDGITIDQWRELNENPDKPLFNRMVQSGYAPGSTFKMITALAGLEEGLVTPETYVECTGVYQLGGNKFRCWNLKGHGHMNVSSSLVRSCDVYFYELAWKLGINRLAKYARMFGLGEPTGTDIPNERRGLIPTTEYYNSRYGFNNWKGGAVVNLGIGQGEILVTPVQLLQYAMIFANAGTYQTPHLVRYAEDSEGIRRVTFPVKHVAVKQEHMDMMRQAMFGVVNYFEGTGKKAGLKAAQVAGKTGTAENVHGKVGSGTEGYHGWFVGFAPYENPEIAIVVLMENGGEGSDVAAPMSALVMNFYFNFVRNKKSFDPKEKDRKETPKNIPAPQAAVVEVHGTTN